MAELRPAPKWVRLTAAVIRHLPAGRYRAIHHLCPRPRSAFLMHLPAEMGGYPFACDLRDTIAREVCFTGRYEPQETALVRSILQPGMTFVDVGANWGYYTLLAASLVGTLGRVLSLEPDPRLFSVLKQNVLRSGLDQVMVIQLAAAKEAGTLMLAGYSEDGGNFGISRIVDKHEEHATLFQVRANSLDHVLDDNGFESVDLMKMDIEGAEDLALAGLMQSLSQRKVKRLLLELHPTYLAEHGCTMSSVIESLERAGYLAWTIDHSPIASREAAYKSNLMIHDLLRPLESPHQFDEWPHQLWLAPGIE